MSALLTETLLTRPIALKMAVAVGIGMLIGMEREWSHKEVSIFTFSIAALLGMLAITIGHDFIKWIKCRSNYLFDKLISKIIFIILWRTYLFDSKCDK